MFKIGDFSKLGQVTTRMLRHYDKMGLLVPNQIDEWTGYRYYTIQQLPRLHRIMALKQLGLSLQQIANLLAKDDDLPAEQLRGMLALRRQELAQEVQEAQQRLLEVEARLGQLERGDQPSPYEVVVKSVAAVPVASLHQLVPNVSEMGFYCESLTNALYRKLGAAGVRWTEPEMILYYSDEYREHDLEIEAAVALPEAMARLVGVDDEMRFQVLPAVERVGALIFEGPFSEMTMAVLELLRWVGTHNHVPTGPLRELHLSGPAHPGEPSRQLPVVELQLPIAPA